MPLNYKNNKESKTITMTDKEPKISPLQRAILLVKHEAPEHTTLIAMLKR